MIQRVLSAAKTLAGAFGSPHSVRIHPKARIRLRMDYARTPDPAWQAQLDAHFPPTERSSRLHLCWDAGDWWQPVHRWTVLQLRPWNDPLIADEFRHALCGPHPRKDATLTKRGVRSLSDRNKIDWEYELDGPHQTGLTDRLCYEVHHEYRRRGLWVIPNRFWVIQGPDGGMPHQLSQSEERLWAIQGRKHRYPGERGPDGLAAPGAEYVDFDARVIRALERRDLWRFAQNADDAGDWAYRMYREQEQAANRMQWQHNEDTMREQVDVFQHLAKKEGLHNQRLVPVGYVAPDRLDPDETKDGFISYTTH